MLTGRNKSDYKGRKELEATLNSFNSEQRQFIYIFIKDKIIIRAIMDYKIALLEKSNSNKAELEMFFFSSWFKFLSDIDGEKLIESLNNAYNTGVIDHRYKSKKRFTS